jgi:hypothetical protein
MSRALLVAAVIAVCLSATATATAALPQPGTLVPGTSLAGIRLGEPAAGVQQTLGHKYGLCQGCAVKTWYFNYRPFDEHGLGIEFMHGRVSAIYTLWQPPGWHSQQGLQLGAVQAQVTQLAGTLIPVQCTGGYEALVTDARTVRTAYYIVDGKLWGFGLMPALESPCR